MAQEARGAAQALRRGIEVKVRESLPPPASSETTPSGTSTIETLSLPMLDGLNALDDAIGMLGDLQTRPGSKRRGRIDVGSLLYELAPNATISLSAEGGTAVFGEEEELRRMFQLLLTESGYHAGGTSPELRVQRVADHVHVVTELGPDASSQSGLERRWLNRMAMRVGGRLEVTGSTQTLILPAEGVVQEAEMKALRQELAEAQELGEVYARELATVLSSAEAHASQNDSAEADPLPELRKLAPALLASARLSDASSTLARTSELLVHLPVHESTTSVDIAAELAPLAASHGASLQVNVDIALELGPAALRALATLSLLTARERARDKIDLSVSFVDARLELVAVFEESDAPTDGFPAHVLDALARHLQARAVTGTAGRVSVQLPPRCSL